MKRARLLLLTMILVFAVTITACGGTTENPSTGTETPQAGEGSADTLGPMLNVSVTSDPGSLDPHLATLVTAVEVMAPLYDRLVYIDDAGVPQPWLAKSWTVSPDGKEITFELHEGIAFHDGTEFNAEAVKFTFDRAMDPELNSKARTSIPVLSETVVVDPFTVKLILDEPFASVFTMLDHSYFSIVSPTAVQQLGAEFGTNPVGTGPFMIKSYEPASKIVMERNPNYQNLRGDMNNTGPAQFEGITFRVISEEGTAVAALYSGDLDLTEVIREDLETFRNDDRYSITEWRDATNWSFIEFNTNKAPFDDVRVRRAVGFALDREQVVDVAWSGLAQPAHSIMPVGVPGYSAEIGLEHGFTYDVKQAEALLDEAGWEKGADGVRLKDGKPLEVIFHNYTNSSATRASQNIQYQLEKIGFKVELVTIETGAMIAGLPDGDHNLNIMRFTWPDPNVLTRMFKTPGWTKQYGNPEIDPILDRINDIVDHEERMKYVEEAQKLLLADAPAIPIATDFRVAVMRKGVEGYRWDNGGIPLFYDMKVTK